MAISGGDGSITLTTKVDEKGLSSGLKSIKNAVSTMERNVTRAGKVMAGAFVAAGVAAIKLGADFEQSAAKASTLFGDVAVDTDNLNKKMLELSSSTGVAATELNEALYSALSAGIPATEDMSEALGILEGSTKLAKAGFTDIDTALSATAKTLNAYGLDTTEAERIQGILIQTQNKGITTVGELGASLAQVTPTAAAFNVSFENVGAALATMTAQGTPTAQATTQLNSLIAELGKQGTIASNNLMKAAEGTQYAGMSFSEMTASGASLGDILSLIAEEAERNDVSMVDMFSSIEAGKAALSIASGEAQTFNSNLEAMTDTSGLVDEAYTKVTNTLSGQTNILIESFKNLGIAIGTGGDVDAAIQNLSTSFGNFASVALPVAQETTRGILQAVQGLLPQIGSMITEMLPIFVSGLENIAQGLSAAIPQIAASVGGLIPEIARKILSLAPQLLSTGIEIIESLTLGISSAIPDLLDMLPDIIDQFVTTLTDNAPLVLQAGIELLLAVVTGISDALPQLISYVPIIVNSLVDVLLNNLPLLIDGGMQLLVAVISGIAAALPQLIAMAPQIVMSVAQTIGRNLSQLLSAGKQIIQAVINGASSLLSSVANIGRNVVQGIWNGISGATSWLIGKIQGFCSSALGAIKSFFGIHSPSRVTRDEVGKPIVQGIAVGIEKAKGLVVKAIDALLTDTRTEVQKVLDELNAEILESEKLYAAESERLKDSTSDADRKYLENLREVAEKERKIYDARQRDIENLKESVVSAYSDMAEEALDSISELQAQQQNLAEKLSAFGGLMTTETRRERGKDVEYTVLADLEEQTATLAAYYNSLQAVKRRGNIPQEFFAVIRDMSIEEGTEYANALLKLTNEEFASYVEAWSKKQDFAEGISKQLYATETGALVEEVEKQFADMEEDFFMVGTGAAEEFEAGFVEQLKGMIATVKDTMSGAFANIAGNDFSLIKIPVATGIIGGRVLPSNHSFAAATSGYAQPVSVSSIKDAMAGVVGQIAAMSLKKEEHYYLDKAELMSLIYDLAEGGKRLQGKSLATGGAY